MMVEQGVFISVEGVDGAGKSTALSWLCARLAVSRAVVQTREPGGTPLGESLRGLLLSESMDLETETLLMFAARREHLAQVIVPALGRGDVVVSDRFTDATFAYQGGGRGLSFERIEALERWVQGAVRPDLTLLFDVPLAVARERLEARAVVTGEGLDRFESESWGFFERTRAAYLARARADVGRVVVIDSTVSFDLVQEQICAAFLQRPFLGVSV